MVMNPMGPDSAKEITNFKQTEDSFGDGAETWQTLRTASYLERCADRNLWSLLQKSSLFWRDLIDTLKLLSTLPSVSTI